MILCASTLGWAQMCVLLVFVGSFTHLLLLLGWLGDGRSTTSSAGKIPLCSMWDPVLQYASQESEQRCAQFCWSLAAAQHHFCFNLLDKASHKISPDLWGREMDSTSWWKDLKIHTAEGVDRGGVKSCDPFCYLHLKREKKDTNGFSSLQMRIGVESLRKVVRIGNIML